METHLSPSRDGQKFLPDFTTIYWDSGDITSKLDAVVPVNTGTSGDTVTDWDKSIVTGNLGSGSLSGINRLRFKPPVGQQGTNTRLWYPITGSKCKDSEMKVLWFAHSKPGITGTAFGNGQFGSVHRMTTNGSPTGYKFAYITWQDVVYGQDQELNIDSWIGTGALTFDQGSATGGGGGNAEFLGLRKLIPVYQTSKLASDVTATVPYGHGVVVGDTVSIEGTEVDETSTTVTAVGATWVTVTSSHSGTFAPIVAAGSGRLSVTSQIFPYWVQSRLIGTTFRVKTWSLGQAEPDWEDERYASVARITNGPAAGTIGLCGIYAGHLGSSTNQSLEYGSVSWRSLD